MSKLDTALLGLHAKLRPDMMFQPDTADESMELSESKEEIKTLILDLFKEVDYDPFEFVDRVSKL